ncbi:MAG: hypothetical protein JWL73_3821 [Actinomycetia bacterium]|nr:hypothetical protein [Actinomycetes bacterium]
MEGDSKPVPVVDAQSEGFWRATAEGRLAVQRCQDCGHFSHPPTTICNACHSVPPSLEFEPVSGRGTIGSWTVMRQAFLPGFAADLPFVLARVKVVEQEDVALIGRLVDGPTAAIELGAAVEVVFESLPGGAAVPAFRLVGARS